MFEFNWHYLFTAYLLNLHNYYFTYATARAHSVVTCTVGSSCNARYCTQMYYGCCFPTVK